MALTSATTRAVPAGASSGDPPLLLRAGQIVEGVESGVAYKIERLIGRGGFGQVFLSTRVGSSEIVPATICIKASPHIDSWLREAYFGQLLDRHPRAIRVYDRFPLQVGRHFLYCLVLEYAPHGDLDTYVRQVQKGWSEGTVRREIAGVLEVLGRLHRGQILHRDLTPMNVFVCEGRRLKLGDFGIVRQQSDTRGVTARTMNALTAPSDILDRAVPKWQARDDVFQVGQLVAMLIKGDTRTRVRPSDVRALGCSDHLKEIVYRCIGERRKRYESANEMIEALRNPPAGLAPGVLRSLDGVHLAFTGILTRRRSEAIAAARRAGAIVHSAPSAQTTVVVRGRPNPLQAAGRDGGRKLLEIKRLREKGHRIISSASSSSGGSRASHEPRQVEAAARLQQRLPEIADLRDPPRHVRDGEIFDAHAAVDFLPRQRRRHGCRRPRAHRVDRGQRAAPPVLVVVHEHAAGRPLREPVLGGNQCRISGAQFLRERLRERPHLLLERARGRSALDVQPFRPGGLHERRHPRLSRASQRPAPCRRGSNPPPAPGSRSKCT